ncbi:MAG: BREX-1 system adenine-specific DNA-methyltransferase PglX [Draconibacterium sp.]|nr:BREX-1 system adenine-specific DNA-methyltransferase PglX [Draconibacterium sp.]
MSLFQKSVEKKYLNDLDSELIDNKYADFQDYFGNPERQENIRNSKEEQFQEGFLRELFVKILGYTLNPEPNFNLTTELKNISNSKKADGAILARGHAPLADLLAVAVIELKSTNTTDLDSVETQAFGYKNHHPKCKYVITSNFEKLRFYIQNAVDHIDFDLLKLTKEQFSLLWLCLAKDNLLNDLPLKIKESSVLQEENITKKLYADYSKFRTAIYNNLLKNNPETDKLLLFKKTQKLLDRFLFIFFAEDRLLVPPNSISQIIEKWKDDVDFGDAKPLYYTFKKYFYVLNVGRPKSGNRQEIYAYNGGLFKPDKILDNITIDDDILHEHTLRLSNYDFETDIDVNILGHIFEHSLGEIESIAADISAATGHAPSSSERGRATVRKRDGIFYTPKYITKYIVENTLGKLCKEKRVELQIVDEEYARGRKNRKKDIVRTLDKKLDEYRNWLLSLTILDPACGSGAFLNQALEFLINEHLKIDELRTQLFGGAILFSDITTDILEKNIFGVDLNEESVDIAKLSLWLRTAQKGRKLNTLSNNIKCGNSLIDDPEIAGDKAFNWQNEFPNIFQKKEKKAWHITTATHNSRYSQRMFDNYVKLGEPVWLDEKDEVIITETVAEIVKKDELNVIEYNICGDHLHILLVCEENELAGIVGKTRGHAPLSEKEEANVRGETQLPMWTQKFGKAEIKDEEYLHNTIEYIRNNRVKHGLDDQNKGARSLVDIIGKMTCTRQHAFLTEYTGGFDVVIGNPPYVRAELLGDFREYFEQNYSVYNLSGDLFSYFYEKSFKLLKTKGLFGFISNTFDKTTAGISLREFLQNEVQFLKYIDFTEVQIFEGATTYPVIITAQNKKGINDTFEYIKIPKTSQARVIDIDLHTSVQVAQNSLDKENWSFKSKLAVKLFDKLKKNKSVREIYGKSFRGLLTGLNEAFIISKTYEVGEHIKPIFEGKELSKWVSSESVQQLILFESKWTKREYGNDITEELALSNLKNDFPDLINHILPLEDRAKRRYDKGDFFWELRNCAYYNLFEKPKIVFPNLQNSNKFAFDETGAYINAPAVILPTNDKFLTAILNSKLVWYFLTNICVVRSGGYIEVKPQYFEQISLPIIPDKFKIDLNSITEKIIESTAEAQRLSNKFIKLLNSKFENIKITKKLEKWFDLLFVDFQKELKKQKIKLLLSDESDWIDFFEQQVKMYSEISKSISLIEEEIDKVVYGLYGLSEEEIKIVEQS